MQEKTFNIYFIFEFFFKIKQNHISNEQIIFLLHRRQLLETRLDEFRVGEEAGSDFRNFRKISESGEGDRVRRLRIGVARKEETRNAGKLAMSQHF